MTSTSSDPIWRHGSWCTFATSRICSTFQRWREGSAPFNWPSEPKKESNFSARFDSIWLCTGLEQNHITWIWSGGRQPTFRGQHHLCLISFGVGFIFTFTGPSVKRFDHLDPLQWLRSCTARGKSERTKWFAHAMQFWMTRLKNLFSFFFNIKRMSQCLMGAWKRYWKVEIGKFGNNLTISFGNFDNFGDKLWTQNRALGTRSSSWSKVFLSFAPGCNSSLRFKSKSAGRWTFVKLLRDCHRLPLLVLLPVGKDLQLDWSCIL